MFDHRFLQHVRFPFLMSEYKLVYANQVSKNKALRNILLLLMYRKAWSCCCRNTSSGLSYSYLTSCLNIYYLRYSVKLILYNFFIFTIFDKTEEYVPSYPLLCNLLVFYTDRTSDSLFCSFLSYYDLLINTLLQLWYMGNDPHQSASLTEIF